MLSRRLFLVSAVAASAGLASPPVRRAFAATPAEKLVAAARSQVGVTLVYDASYSKLDFPGGDVPRRRGVCTDVIVRAYRDALAIDLQARIHADMRRGFSAYPALWGAKTTDRNIDHRRVPNLQAFFTRAGAGLPVSAEARDYRPGDIVSQMLPGNKPHIGIVADSLNADGSRPLIVHNIGRGTQVEDVLFTFPITGRYRYEI